ncbi:hypothetical protein BST61_g823 [Cercospora zeina]
MPPSVLTDSGLAAAAAAAVAVAGRLPEGQLPGTDEEAAVDNTLDCTLARLRGLAPARLRHLDRNSIRPRHATATAQDKL